MNKKPVRESSKRQEIREARRRRQRQSRLVVLLGIGGIALLVAVLVVVPRLFRPEVVENPRPMADFNMMGDPNAPVKIVEYSDFQCAYCRRHAEETEPLIVEQYVETGKVHLTYVPYGFAGNGAWPTPESGQAANAAFCAGEQGKFWEYHDLVFANQGGEASGALTNQLLISLAEDLNLDMGQFRSCFNDKKYADQIQAGIDQGNAAEVSGTPSFLINGKLIVGAQPFDVFQQEIEAALAAAGGS